VHDQRSDARVHQQLHSSTKTTKNNCACTLANRWQPGYYDFEAAFADDLRGFKREATSCGALTS
jgi:hypothetical protein